MCTFIFTGCHEDKKFEKNNDFGVREANKFKAKSAFSFQKQKV